MKALAYTLIAVSLFMLWSAASQEFSGQAVAQSPDNSFVEHRENRDTNPQSFRNLMTYQWLAASLTGLAGLFLLSLIRSQNRVDPFSPEFQGADAVDELSVTLDQLKKRKTDD